MGSFFSASIYLVFCVLLVLVQVCFSLIWEEFSSVMALKVYSMSLTWDSSSSVCVYDSKTLSFHDVPQFLHVPFSSLTSSLSLLWGLIPVLQIWNCLLSSTWLILLMRIPTSLNFLMRFLRFFNYIFISAWVLLSIPIFNWVCFSNPGLSSSFHFCFVVVIFFGTIHVFITITSFIELLSMSPLNL